MTLTETQEAILDAVQSVIVREGVGGASMRQVAEAADVSLGLLSYHFDDKQTLTLAAFERAANELFGASVAAADAVVDSEERVVAFLRGSFTEEFLAGEYLRLRIALWTVAVSDPDVAKLDAAFYDRYRQKLISLVSEALPDVDVGDVEERVADVLALMNGLWLQWARFAKTEDLERGLRRCEALVLGGAI